MEVKLGISTDGTIKISTGSKRVRIESVDKFLNRNHDAMLVKLEGDPDPSIKYKPGHLCEINDDGSNKYNVFVGSHFIGYLPPEAIAFAESIESSPAFLVAMVGKVEHDDNTDTDKISIYIAE